MPRAMDDAAAHACHVDTVGRPSPAHVASRGSVVIACNDRSCAARHGSILSGTPLHSGIEAFVRERGGGEGSVSSYVARPRRQSAGSIAQARL